MRNNRFTKAENESNSIKALDLEVQTKIPKPGQERKLWDLKGEDSKIPKIVKGPLPAIPEKLDSLPWKKGDLLDSLGLSSTNLKKFMKNKPKACESPGREKGEREWLMENFRESIKEWAPTRPQPDHQVLKEPQITNPDYQSNINPITQKPSTEKIKDQIRPIPTADHAKPNDTKAKAPESQNKINKRVIPRGGGKSGFNNKLEELKENNRPDKKVKFFNEKLPGKANTRYTDSDFEDENPHDHQSCFSEPGFIKANPNPTPINQLPKENPKKEAISKPPIIKPSKFVSKFKEIETDKNEFLNKELKSVNDEEAKLEASLARLDIKSLKLKHQAELELLNQQAKNLEESLKRARELPIKQPADEYFEEIEDETYIFEKEKEKEEFNGGQGDGKRDELRGDLNNRIQDSKGKQILGEGRIERNEKEVARQVVNNLGGMKGEGNGAGGEYGKCRYSSNKAVKNFKPSIADDQASVAPTDYSGKTSDPAPGPRTRSVVSGYSSRLANPHIKIRGQCQKPPSAPQSNPGSLHPLSGADIVKVNPNIDLKSIFSGLSSP